MLPFIDCAVLVTSCADHSAIAEKIFNKSNLAVEDRFAKQIKVAKIDEEI